MGNHTNFDPVRRPAPALERVVTELERCPTVKRSGFFLASDFDAMAKATDKSFYETYAHRAGLRKFLIDHRVILKDGNKFYVDPDRAADVILACRKRTSLVAPKPASVRLQELKVLVKARTTETTQDTESAIDGFDTEDEESGNSSATTFVAPAPALIETPVVIAGLPSVPEVVKSKEPVVLKYVLFLTPVEMDVWTTLCVLAHDALETEIRAAISADQDQFFLECASATLGCTSEEYEEAIQRFITSSLLSNVVGKIIEGKRALRFLVNWEEFLCIQIKTRGINFVEVAYIELMHEIQHDVLGILANQQSVLVRFNNYIDRNYSALNHDTARFKLTTYSESRISAGWGILFRHEQSGRRLLCWPGFERFEFRERTDMRDASVVSQPPPSPPPSIKSNPVASSLTYRVSCDAQAANVLLQIANDEYIGGLQRNREIPYSLIRFLNNIGFLQNTGGGKYPNWIVDADHAALTRFEICTSRDNGSHGKFRIVEGPLPKDIHQWRKDLEEIVATTRTPGASVADVPASDPDAEFETGDELVEDIAAVQTPAPEVMTRTLLEMPLEELRVLEESQRQMLDLANTSLECVVRELERLQREHLRVQTEVGLCEFELLKTQKEIKDRKRKVREVIEQELETERARVRVLEERLAALND